MIVGTLFAQNLAQQMVVVVRLLNQDRLHVVHGASLREAMSDLDHEFMLNPPS